MKDIDDIRRDNLRILERESGGPTEAAKKAAMSPSQFTNLRDGARDARTGKRRGMRKETARKFEIAFEKHPGWMDIDHDAADSPGRIQSIYDKLSPTRKIAAEQAILGLLALENAEKGKL